MSNNIAAFLRANKISIQKIIKYIGKDYFIYNRGELAHYTTLTGFKGIIEENGFWLSDHRLLNDKEEFDNGRKLAICLITQLQNKTKYINFKKILNQVLINLKNYEEKPLYICSFSLKKDCLDLWKWYSKNDVGLSLVFNNDEVFFHRLPKLITSKVFYNKKIKSKILLFIIKTYYEEYLKDESEEKYKKQNDIILPQSLTNALVYHFIQFKHPEFESEQELRMVYPENENYSYNIYHRLGIDKIIPYITTSDEYKDLGKLPLKEIIIGPNNKQKIIKKSLEIYLKNKGYENVQVSFSKIPFRG